MQNTLVSNEGEVALVIREKMCLQWIRVQREDIQDEMVGETCVKRDMPGCKILKENKKETLDRREKNIQKKIGGMPRTRYNDKGRNQRKGGEGICFEMGEHTLV